MARVPGVTDVRLGSEGLSYSGNDITCAFKWSAITGVIAAEGHTLLLLSAYELFPIPDIALPTGIAPDTLRARISDWRRKATP